MSRLHANSEGNILLLVIGVMAIGALLLAATLRLSDNQTLQVFGFYNREDALKRAEQGYNKYLWELNRDSTFYLDSSRFEKTVDTNEKQVYQPIDQPNGENYLVEIEIPVKLVGSTYMPISNQVIIRSTGWSSKDPGKKRTLQVALQKRSFAQYGMITNKDTVQSSGDKIYWVSGEKFYGPLHTNGTLYIDGTPVFYGPVTYGVAISPSSKAIPSIFRGGQAKVATINWPPSNSKLMAQARIGDGGDYYEGRTCIMLYENGYDVRRWVSYDSTTKLDTWEYNGHPYQFEKTSNADAYKDKGNFYFPSKADCNGTPTFTSFSAVRSYYDSISYPSNGVIYVNGGTDTSYGKTTSKCSKTLGNVFVSGRMEGQLTIACSNDIFITAWDPTDWRNPWKNGDSTAFSSFTKTGGLHYPSSSTDFNQVITNNDWDYTEVTGSDRTDILGLVADNNIYILHYSWPAQVTDKISSSGSVYASNGGWTNGLDSFPSGDGGPDSAPYGIYIYGALFTTQGSYQYELWDQGPDKGNITLVGSIAQNYRGPIGQGSHGYNKLYSHDPRMLYTSPPYYIEPENTGWQVGEWKEITAAVTKASS